MNIAIQIVLVTWGILGIDAFYCLKDEIKQNKTWFLYIMCGPMIWLLYPLDIFFNWLKK